MDASSLDAWLAQLVEHQTAVQAIEGLSLVLGQHRLHVYICNYICKKLDIQVFLNKDYKP